MTYAKPQAWLNDTLSLNWETSFQDIFLRYSHPSADGNPMRTTCGFVSKVLQIACFITKWIVKGL